jgi:hypothetical protein
VSVSLTGIFPSLYYAHIALFVALLFGLALLAAWRQGLMRNRHFHAAAALCVGSMLLVLATAYGRGAQLQVPDPQHVESLIIIIPCVAIALKVITQCYGKFIQFLAVAVYGLILCVGFGTRYDMAAEFRPWRTLSLSAIAKAQAITLRERLPVQLGSRLMKRT